MTIAEEIEARLAAAFSPERLVVTDDSEAHRGHGGWREGGETHFRIDIDAAELRPMSRLARHRAIHDALGKDLVERIHALEIHAAA